METESLLVSGGHWSLWGISPNYINIYYHINIYIYILLFIYIHTCFFKSWDTLPLSHGKLLFKSLGCLNNGAILHFELPWVARMRLHNLGLILLRRMFETKAVLWGLVPPFFFRWFWNRLNCGSSYEPTTKKDFIESATLPETNIFAPEHQWLEISRNFLLGSCLFSGAKCQFQGG